MLKYPLFRPVHPQGVATKGNAMPSPGCGTPAPRSSRTPPLLNIWGHHGKASASVNPDWPIKTRKFPSPVTNTRNELCVVKGEWWCAGEIYTLTSVVSQVRGITWRNGTFRRARVQTLLQAVRLSSLGMKH